tara:strand:- start:643 stop:957 length:315 start_codon:yes stop_codon:yes gene_type:complete
MSKYRKKPVVIEAVQFTYTPEGMARLRVFCDGALGDVRWQRHIGAHEAINVKAEATIKTLEDGANGQVTHIATEGDYIIKGVQGEFYPCKSDIFAATYEEVSDE